MKAEKVDEVYRKLSLFEEKPKVGEYFGVIEVVNYVVPYYSDKKSCTYGIDFFKEDQEYNILLFKKIGEETIIEVSTGIPFLLNPDYQEYPYIGALEHNKYFQEKFLKYKKVGLSIISDDYLKVNDEFKLLYFKEMNQDSKEKLKNCAKIAHKEFDDAFTEIINKTQAIASVDNAMYDMEKKCKVKALTKPNDDQK